MGAVRKFEGVARAKAGPIDEQPFHSQNDTLPGAAHPDVGAVEQRRAHHRRPSTAPPSRCSLSARIRCTLTKSARGRRHRPTSGLAPRRCSGLRRIYCSWGLSRATVTRAHAIGTLAVTTSLMLRISADDVLRCNPVPLRDTPRVRLSHLGRRRRKYIVPDCIDRLQSCAQWYTG